MKEIFSKFFGRFSKIRRGFKGFNFVKLFSKIRRGFRGFNFVRFSSRFKIKDYRKTTAFFVVLSLLLLIGVIIVAVYYAKTRKLLTYSERVCLSDECLRTASNFQRSMDLSIDPCEDFYQYTCGRWGQVHDNREWERSFSNFAILNEEIERSILKFLQSSGQKDDPVSVNQSRLLYQSCLDLDASDKLGYTVVHKYLQEVGLPVVPEFFNPGTNQSSFDLIEVTVKLMKTLGLDTFMQFSLQRNQYNNTLTEFHLYCGPWMPRFPRQLGHDEELRKVLRQVNKEKINGTDELRNSTSEEDGDSDNSVEAMASRLKGKWKKYISAVLKDVVDLSDDLKVEEAIDIVFNFTNNLYKIVTGNYSDNSEERPYTVHELQNITDECLMEEGVQPFEFFKPYLEQLFEDVEGSYFDFEEDLIYVYEFELTAACKTLAYIGSTPGHVLELYSWFSLVKTVISTTTTEMREKDRFRKPFSKQVTSRARECANLAVSYLPLAVSYGIADKSFSNTTGLKVNGMLEEIKTAFVDQVESLKWMDKKTKMAAIEKANNMLGFIGFPEWLTNVTALEDYHCNVTITATTFLDNIIQIMKCKIEKELKAYKRQFQKDMIASPTVVNAFHYPNENSIHIPMAVINFPMYNLGLEMLNYGALGSVLGHEFIHGFDNNGRHFDKVGNIFEWWSNKTDRIFTEKAQCFVDQYSNFYYESVDLNINGRQTLGENLADNGGTGNAYTAYQRYIKKHGEEKVLPGFEDFTAEQMFFVAYASWWCNEEESDETRWRIQGDPHTPAMFRVLGVLQNSEDFASAFKCSKGTKMNPKGRKCKIW